MMSACVFWVKTPYGPVGSYSSLSRRNLSVGCLEGGDNTIYWVTLRKTTIDTSNFVVEWLTLLLRICEFPGSSLGPETGYPD
jgi:hypothetical protein